MRAVYRRAAALALAAASAIALGCRAQPQAHRPPPAPPPDRDTLDAFLASHRILPAPRAAGAELRFGTRLAATGTQAVALGSAGWTASAPPPSRALAQLAPDVVLLEIDGALRLDRGAAGARALTSFEGGAVRLLAVGAEELWLAAGGSAGRLVRLDRLGAPRDLGALPAGLEARVATPDGARLALTRAAGSEGDLLFLHERADGSTRLLLPTDAEGRFQPLAFSPDGGRLLLLADDRSDLPRAEWLDLASGERTPLSPPDCAALGAAPRGDHDLAIPLACRARAELLLLEAGAPSSLPAPADSRAVEAWPEGSGAWLYAVASARRPRDLWRLEIGAEPRPLVHGLAPVIDPADLVAPTPLDIDAPGGAVPGELWLPRGPAAGLLGGVVWIDYDQGPALWFEFDPVLQFLAQRGVAVLRLRLPGADGFGRAFRLRGAEASRAERAALIEAAARALAERTSLARHRLALVALGARPGAAAIEAALAGPRFAAVVAVDPAPLTASPPGEREATALLVVAAPPPAPPPAHDPAAEPAPPDLALAVGTRLEVAAPAPGADRLTPPVVAALWRHLSAGLTSAAGTSP